MYTESGHYDSAAIVMRAGVIQKGHENLVDTALNLADRVLILVGSAQESGTERNPFDVGTRMDMIREIYNTPRVIVKPLPDLTHENDLTTEWGDYVIKHFKQYLHKMPELLVYGKEPSRYKWFDEDGEICNTVEIVVSRNKIQTSATENRILMAKDMREEWMANHNQKLHKFYDMLRGQLMSVDYYKNIAKQVYLENV